MAITINYDGYTNAGINVRPFITNNDTGIHPIGIDIGNNGDFTAWNTLNFEEGYISIYPNKFKTEASSLQKETLTYCFKIKEDWYQFANYSEQRDIWLVYGVRRGGTIRHVEKFLPSDFIDMIKTIKYMSIDILPPLREGEKIWEKLESKKPTNEGI